MSNDHYVYAFLEPLTDIPRYVGQGTKSRYSWWRRDKSESQYGVHSWLRKLKARGQEPNTIKIAEYLTKEQADYYEVDLIEFIGRVVDKIGPLLNLTKGGAGSLGVSRQGRKLSVEHKQKISESNTIAYAKPEVKKRKSAVSKEVNARPEVKARKSKKATENNAKPDVKARQKATLKVTNALPNVKVRRSTATKESWKKPKIAKQRKATLKATNALPEVKKRRSKAMDDRWAEPAYRDYMLRMLSVARDSRKKIR